MLFVIVVFRSLLCVCFCVALCWLVCVFVNGLLCASALVHVVCVFWWFGRCLDFVMYAACVCYVSSVFVHVGLLLTCRVRVF